MKRFLPILILAAVLLTGCGEPREPTIPATEPPPTEAILPPEPTGYYDPGSALEEISQGALKLYPLSRTGSTAIVPFGDDLLLVSGFNGTTLSVLSGNNMYVSAVANLDCYVEPSSPAFVVTKKGVTYYDAEKHSLIFLDASLKEVNRISLPDNSVGDPCVSGDRKTIFYCTPNSLRAIDLETDLDKLLREMNYNETKLVNIHCANSILECIVFDDSTSKTLFISTQTGATICERETNTMLWTHEDRYCTVHYDGAYRELLVGIGNDDPSVLLEEDFNAELYPMLNNNALVCFSCSKESSILKYYDLTTGMRTAALELEDIENPRSFQSLSDLNCVWFLGYDKAYESDVLYRWDLLKSPTEDPNIYLAGRRSADNPDLSGIEQCILHANELSEKHGVEILLWQDALICQPWDYTFVPEYQVPVLQRSLQVLDDALSCFPEGFLKKAAYGTDSKKIHICLVRQLIGNPDANVLDSALGIQFWDENEDAYVVLAADQQMEQTFFHEFFHIIESRVLSKSSAYDNWNALNPEGFDYDYDYTKNLSRDDSQWTSGKNRAFIDLYSMSFPKEDRARLMEYAAMPGNEACFESDAMQQKLRQLCIGIRDAFRLEKSAETFRWEQYLSDPLGNR